MLKIGLFFSKKPCISTMTTQFYQNFIKNFATKMRQGATKNNKDSPGKRLGVKKFGGESVLQNQIIVLL